MKTIRFKSYQENWKKEYLGLKSNTVRFIDQKDNDIRFEIMFDYINGKINLLNIELENTLSKETFIREVTDITYFQNFFIISWIHPR